MTNYDHSCFLPPVNNRTIDERMEGYCLSDFDKLTYYIIFSIRILIWSLTLCFAIYTSIIIHQYKNESTTKKKKKSNIQKSTLSFNQITSILVLLASSTSVLHTINSFYGIGDDSVSLIF